jgi:DNA-binding NarL/FixJ family response regulator
VREAFTGVLQQYPGLCVVGVACDGLDAIAQAYRLRPDVILMDISMPYMDGVEATRRIRNEFPFIQIVGLSMQPRTDAPHAIEQAGAAGFFVKGADTQPLIDHLLRQQHHRNSGHPTS